MDDVSLHLAEYRERHYTVVRNFYPRAVVDAYREFLQQALHDEVEPVFASLGLDMRAPDAAEAVTARLTGDQPPEPAARHLLLGHFPLHVRLSERIHPLARHLGQSALLKRLLDSDQLHMHMPPMMRFVPPRYAPAAVPPHQDSSYNAHMSGFVTVWTPLVPIDLECGGMIMYEGSQHMQQHVGQDKSGWLEALDTGAFPATQLDGLFPGDVVILSPHIVHGSAPNLSQRIRFSMDLRIFGAGGSSSKHHMNLDTLEVTAA